MKALAKNMMAQKAMYQLRTLILCRKIGVAFPPQRFSGGSDICPSRGVHRFPWRVCQFFGHTGDQRKATGTRASALSQRPGWVWRDQNSKLSCLNNNKPGSIMGFAVTSFPFFQQAAE